MFESLKQKDSKTALTRFTSLIFSLVIHGAIAGLIVVLPLVFFNVLHADELITFLIEPPHTLPDLPAPPAPAVRHVPNGIAVIAGSFDPVPRSLPEGIPAPEESDAPPVWGHLIDGIRVPGYGLQGGSAISSLLEKDPVIVVKKPAPPVAPARIRVGGDVQASKLVHKVAPVYPRLAIQARVSGIVELDADIDEEGNVTNVKIVSGHPLLVDAAVRAVMQWKYSPTFLNGEPLRILANVKVIFRLR
jgi:protein TonB